MTRPMLLMVLVAALVCAWVIAAAGPVTAPPQASSAPAIPPEYTLGEIQSVDPHSGAVTVKHEPIRHLGMPEMTMRFRLADPGRAHSLRAGDMVRFRAEKRDGTLVITDVARR